MPRLGVFTGGRSVHTERNENWIWASDDAAGQLLDVRKRPQCQHVATKSTIFCVFAFDRITSEIKKS